MMEKRERETTRFLLHLPPQSQIDVGPPVRTNHFSILFFFFFKRSQIIVFYVFVFFSLPRSIDRSERMTNRWTVIPL